MEDPDAFCDSETNEDPNVEELDGSMLEDDVMETNPNGQVSFKIFILISKTWNTFLLPPHYCLTLFNSNFQKAVFRWAVILFNIVESKSV